MIKTLVLVSALQIAYRAYGDQGRTGAILEEHGKNDGNAKFGYNKTNPKFSRPVAHRVDSDTDYPRHDVKHYFTLTPGNSTMLNDRSTWKGAVFCPVHTYAFGYQNRHDEKSGIDHAQGITEITLYCKTYGRRYVRHVHNFEETAWIVTSGSAIGELGSQEFCQIKRGPTEADQGVPAQFLMGAEAFFGNNHVGAVSFSPICEIPDPVWWEKTAKFIGSSGQTSPISYCHGTINRAKRGAATASSQYDSETSASMAFAGPSKQWHSAAGMPQWIKYELSEKWPICKIVFSPRRNNADGNTRHDCPKHYKLFGSNKKTEMGKALLEEKLSAADIQADCVPNRKITKYIPSKESFDYYTMEIKNVEGRTQSHNQKYAVLGDIQLYSINDITKPQGYTLFEDNTVSKHEYHRKNRVWLSERSTRMCPAGQGICGIDTRVDSSGFHNQRNRINEINEIKIFCCEFPKHIVISPVDE